MTSPKPEPSAAAYEFARALIERFEMLGVVPRERFEIARMFDAARDQRIEELEREHRNDAYTRSVEDRLFSTETERDSLAAEVQRLRATIAKIWLSAKAHADDKAQELWDAVNALLAECPYLEPPAK